MKKINRNKRIVVTTMDIKYIVDEKEKIIECVIKGNIRHRNKHLGSLKVVGVAICVDNDFNIEFGKTLARAKAELEMYKEIRNKCLTNIFHNIENNDPSYLKTDIKAFQLYLNTIDFSEAMIKHQINYINNIIRIQYPNE